MATMMIVIMHVMSKVITLCTKIKDEAGGCSVLCKNSSFLFFTKSPINWNEFGIFGTTIELSLKSGDIAIKNTVYTLLQMLDTVCRDESVNSCWRKIHT